jgi:hypothetical protein
MAAALHCAIIGVCGRKGKYPETAIKPLFPASKLIWHAN